MFGSSKILIAALAVVAMPVLGQSVLADPVAHEDKDLGGSTVRLYLHPGLTEAELTVLRMVQTNRDALSMFLPQGAAGGYAAIAMAPEEGFVREGQPVASAVAISGLADAATAEADALAACDKARKSKDACVVLLTVAPKG